MTVKEEKITVPQENIAQKATPTLITSLPTKPIYTFFKRCFDILFSIVGLIVLFIPLIIVSLIVYIDCPQASPIYVQDRIGKNGKKFRFYKFRSMIPNAENMLDSLLDKNEIEGPAFKMKDDPRITKFGRFIRRTSIDELPQLWNVLKGDMSIVGPRPPLPREEEQYNAYQNQRLMVTPGLTCLWQIQPKRNSLSFEEWLELDIKYILERNFWMDIKIIFKTIGAICGLEGE